MIEKKFVKTKKQEFEIKEFIKKKLGKGKISDIKIERTPIGEKIIIVTSKPGLVIGKGGENIREICGIFKRKFKFENPQVDIEELREPIFDAQTVADKIALSLERFGPLSFKLTAYRQLEQIAKAGALGAEIRVSGKLPSERAKSWRFAFGYLIKTGESSKIVNMAQATAFTKPGAVGVKVSIVPKGTRMPDKIEINHELIKSELKEKIVKTEEEIKKTEEKKKEEEKERAEKEKKKKAMKKYKKKS